MRTRQKGITLIGWLFLLVPVAIVGYSVIRLTPVYLNYMKVAKAMNQTAEEFAGEEQINPTAIQRSLQRQFTIDSVDYPGVDAIQVQRNGTEWSLRANYEDVVPLFAGISLLVRFDKSAAVK